MFSFRQWSLVLLLSVLNFAGVGIAKADDQPPVPKVYPELHKETTVPCFVPGGTPPPEGYLKRNMKGFGDINRLFYMDLTKGADVGNFLTGRIFDVKMELGFQEPALLNAEREKNKELAPNKDNLWKLPEGAKAWADIKPQYSFYLKTQSFDPVCANDGGLQFRILCTRSGEESAVRPLAVVWKQAKADDTKIGGQPAAAPRPGITFSFNPSNTLYKNEGILYTGVALSESIDSITVEATNCFGQKMIYTYHLKNGQVPKYVETRDSGSGMIQGKLAW